MKHTKSVLIVDDEAEYLNTLKDCFENAEFFKYSVEAYKMPSQCIGLGNRNFDLCVVDLGIGQPRPTFPGFNLLIGLSCLRNGGAGIVYSAYPETRNVVLAMQLGATAFYSKADFAPDEFVTEVDQWLHAQQRKACEDEMIARYVVEQATELCREHAGKTVGIELEGDTPIVVASGNSRLEMLLDYQQRYDMGHRSLDDNARSVLSFPYVHQVPDRDQGADL